MKIRKKISYLLLALISISIAAMYFGANFFIKQKLEKKLGELINTNNNPYYEYHLDDFHVKLLPNSVRLSGISVRPTEYALSSVKNMDNELRLVGDFHVEEILLEGFQIDHFLSSGKIILDDFKVTNPSFVIHHNIKKNNKDTSTVLVNTLTNRFISARLGNLSIDNANLKIKEINSVGADVNLKAIDIHLTKSYVDTLTIKQFFPFQFDNIELNSAGLDIDLSEFYELQSSAIAFDLQSNTFAIQNFQLIPKYSHKEFEKISEFNVSEYAFDSEQVSINGFSFEKFRAEGKLKVDKIKLSNNKLELYNNKNKKMPTAKEKFLWATLLRKIPLAFTLDTLILAHSRIDIHEKSALTKELSHLFFDDLNAQITGISTDSSVVHQQQYMMVKVNTRFLGEYYAELNLKIDLTSKQDNYWVNGKMGKMNARAFNQVLKPLFNAKVASGNIKKSSFNYFANSYKSKGKIEIEYEDLKLEIHSNVKHKKHFFSSLLANSVVKTHNLKHHRGYKQGEIASLRNKNKSFFNVLWKSLQSGIIDILIPKKILKEIKRQQSSVKK